MYDKLIQNYRVLYEGTSEPIFYKSFYPMGIDDEDLDHWALHHYGRGLKHDSPSDERDYEAHVQEYERELQSLLDCFVDDTVGLRRGVVVVPPSTVGEVNRVTELVRKVVGASRDCVVTDLTQYFRRTQNKQKAHVGGSRSVFKNMDTLQLSPDCEIQSYDAILVLDDITTTGGSFVAANTKLRDAGFRGQIANFAFARTCPSEGVYLHDKWEARNRTTGGALPKTRGQQPFPQAHAHAGVVGHRVSFSDGSVRVFKGRYWVVRKARYVKGFLPFQRRKLRFDRGVDAQFEDGSIVGFDSLEDLKKRVKRTVLPRRVDGIVFDFDDTIISITPRDLNYEACLLDGEAWETQANAAVRCPYELYPGVREVMELGIPFAVVSNRRIELLSRIVSDPAIHDGMYPRRMDWYGRASKEGRSSGERPYPAEPIKDDGVEANRYGNLFSFPTRRIAGYGRKFKLFKPCRQGVLQAVELIRSSNGLEADSRIVGIGNTPEDIIAYDAAGLETALALWGVPEYLREHARRHWGADHCFDSMSEFGRWCMGD